MNNEELINDIIDKLNASVKDIDDQLSALEGADELDDTVNNRRFTLEQRKAPLENLIRSMQGVATNIQALKNLDEIVPRDDQDREEMRDERRQREEENDRRLSELPLEYQREIDDFAIAEVAEIEERIEELRNNRQTTLASEYFKRMTTEEHDLARLRERLYNSALRETEALRGLNEQNSTEEEREYQEEIVKKLRESLTDEQRESLDNAMREQNVDQVQQEVSEENTDNPEIETFEGLIEHIISELESSRDSVSQQLAELEGADELDDTVNERRFSLELRRQNFDNLIRSMQGVTTNIRALNELDEIVPRDDQDREEMREERRQREEENDRRLNELPLEYQREIDDFVIAEMARTEERIEELRNNRQTTLASEYAKRMAKEEHNLERFRERLYNSTLREIEELNSLSQTGRDENERAEQEERVIKLRRNLTDEQRRRTDAVTDTNSDVNQDQVGLNSDQTVVPNPTEVTGTGQNAEPNPTEVTEGEQTRLPELNKDVNILDENFNPFSISFDDFTNRVSTERRRLLAENTAESASNLQKINDMYQRVARVRAQERYDPTYAHDENGNVIYYTNTFVPRPREQSPLEDMEQYNAFLTNEYGRRVSEAQYWPENTESQTREQAYTYIREPAPYRLTRDQIIQDLPINSLEESRYQGRMTDEEIEAARRQIFPTTTAQVTETNETQVEGTSTPTESDSQEVEPTAPVSEEVGNEGDDITTGIRETNSYPALPPAEERPALPPGEERLALPPGKETEDKDEPKPNPVVPKDTPLLPESKPRRSLDSILADIKCDENGNPFEIDAKIGNTLRASNIKASQVFTDELRNTPWTYAVLGIAPAFVKATFAFISKAAAKAKLFFTGKPNVEEQIRERIRQLPREEQETIFREYRGNIALQRKEASVVNNAITAEMGRIGAEIAERNEAIMSEIYTEVFARYKEAQAYDDAIAQATTDEEKAELTRRKASALEGSADLINQFRMLNIETNQLKSGGIKGQQDDLNAVNSKMNYQGRRHAKLPKYDEEYAELDRHIGELADDEIAAIANGDNERAVKRFVERELEYAQNTENRGSLFGKRSVGRFDFKPLPVDLDYRPDPFVRNLFSTIAIAGAAISTFNGIQTHLREQQQAIDAHNQHIADANAHNQATMDQVHTTGQDIADHREVFGEGMKAQAQEDIIGRINTNERYGLDSSAAEYGSWAINTDTYRQIDDAGHAVAEQMQQQAQTGLNDIANQVAAGTMTQQQALQGLSDLANSTQQSFNELLEQSLPVLQNYIPGHPQFELDGLSQAMQYMVSHPDAISQMNQGMVDVTALGESLGGLTFDQVQALGNLPSDLATTLFGAASAAALVTNVNSNMQPRPKNKETNSELFRMVEEFSEEQAERASTDTKDDSYQKSA